MYRSMGDMLTQQSATVRAAPTMMALTTTGAPVRASAQSVAMPVNLPAIPGCLDAGWLKARAYCAENPGGGGPDPILNTACTAARRQPGYYTQLLSTPPCGGGGFTPMPDEPGTETEANGEPNYMLWGGLALLLVAAGGGVYYYTKKK